MRKYTRGKRVKRKNTNSRRKGSYKSLKMRGGWEGIKLPDFNFNNEKKHNYNMMGGWGGAPLVM